MSTARELLLAAYAYFNARDIDSVLQLMHPDVDWPNGMEGGRVHGHNGVREYWTRQWSLIDPNVEPVGFATGSDGRTVVKVHQVVRDLGGKVLADQMVEHTHWIENELIRKMDIGGESGSSNWQ